MQLQPQLFNLNNLLNGRLFRIPEYQRAYSWEKKQRDDLFGDIERVKASDEDHFMATVVGLTRGKKQIIADQFAVVEIVDGQQRLTTLIILPKAIQRALNTEDKTEKKLSEELSELLVKGDDLNLPLLQTNHDSSLYFTWAQGYMSGVNLMFGVQNKPPTNFALWSLQDEKAFIHTYCADHPLETYEQAVIQLFGSLRHAQNLTKQ